MAEATVPVTQRALIQRINRALRREDQILRQARGDRARQDLGGFYVIDVRLNAVVSKDVDLEALARDLGALKGYEHVVWDDGE